MHFTETLVFVNVDFILSSIIVSIGSTSTALKLAGVSTLLGVAHLVPFNKLIKGSLPFITLELAVVDAVCSGFANTAT